MYSTYPSFVLAFHGCDRTVGEDVLSGKTHLKQSRNDYDWLGQDCAVIEFLHTAEKIKQTDESGKQFDTVRGAFWEGDDLYPDAGFKSKNHIQICVRNLNCIKGCFRPLKEHMS